MVKGCCFNCAILGESRLTGFHQSHGFVTVEFNFVSLVLTKAISGS